MPVMLRHTSKGSRKRHTWPRAVVEQLETIPESPRAPINFDVSTPDLDVQSRPDLDSNPKDELLQAVTSGTSAEELRRAQMLWYSHHLAESQQDRERLSRKIKELENAYRTQSKVNAGLRDDVKSWQHSYDLIEAELVEVVQEIEEAKAYVRSIETSNANLRYTLSQVKEQTELKRQKTWRFRVSKLFTQVSGHVAKLFQSRQTKSGRGRHSELDKLREGSETPVTHSRRTDLNRAGACSRLSKRRSDPELPSSSPQGSPVSEKG